MSPSRAQLLKDKPAGIVENPYIEIIPGDHLQRKEIIWEVVIHLLKDYT